VDSPVDSVADSSVDALADAPIDALADSSDAGSCVSTELAKSDPDAACLSQGSCSQAEVVASYALGNAAPKVAYGQMGIKNNYIYWAVNNAYYGKESSITAWSDRSRTDQGQLCG
jgi:hypothetical protein